MTQKPNFIDNRGHNTLAMALKSFLGDPTDDLATGTDCPSGTVRIVTAFFNPTGFAGIAHPFVYMVFLHKGFLRELVAEDLFSSK